MKAINRIPATLIGVSLAIFWAIWGKGGGRSDWGAVESPSLVAFSPNRQLTARIRRTEYGVPHITAKNLESLGFGVGYAYAEDNICLLADQIVKYNSQRSRYFGPGSDPDQGNVENLITDFSYLALEIRAQAEAGFPLMSENSRALFSGYAKGYNQFLQDTGISNIDPRCADQPWVKPITPVDLVTYSLGFALLAGVESFLAPIFLAAPAAVDPSPTMVTASSASASGKAAPERFKLDDIKNKLPQKKPLELGSNGWGLGKELTENGRGMVLGNPHFPHTGALRFWQFHTTIPGVLNVIGASLSAAPGVVNIGFNENVAWTHTVSTAEQFIVYQLDLDETDTTGLTYINGAHQTITSKVLTVDVMVAPNTVVSYEKPVYYSEFGPMIEADELLPWDDNKAYSIKDANQTNFDIVDHWLAMNLAKTMDEFKQAFRDFDGVIFVNTLAADKKGNTFYIDDSTVPDLSDAVTTALETDSAIQATREELGFHILPGVSEYDYNTSVPYEDAPKLENTTFVQNSNNSFWLTNPDTPITGVSRLYGRVDEQQSLRSRLGQRLLTDSAGADGKFNLAEVVDALLNNRNYLGEEVLKDLLTHCRGAASVTVDAGKVDISAGCTALSNWDGCMNLNSTAAHLFREFAQQFSNDPQWSNAFNASDPLNTPNTLLQNKRTLEHFANAILKVEEAGLELDAELGEVQFVERSTVEGFPTGVKLPWGGANNTEGGFNVFRPDTGSNRTLIPRHIYPTLENSQLSVEGGGYHINFGSSWIYVVNFTDNGPIAEGLLTYSQSINPESLYFLDQTQLYSIEPQLRPIRFAPIRFTEQDIEDNKISDIEVSDR